MYKDKHAVCCGVLVFPRSFLTGVLIIGTLKERQIVYATMRFHLI